MKLACLTLFGALALACSGSTAGVDLTGPAPTPTTTSPTEPTLPGPVPGPGCPVVAAACDPGDVQVTGPDDCHGLACYSRGQDDRCGKQIWCADNTPDDCKARPTCDPGDTAVPACPAGPNGSSCYPRTLCGTTITCLRACKPATCNPGDEEVKDATDCNKPKAGCYSVVSCNTKVLCKPQ